MLRYIFSIFQCILNLKSDIRVSLKKFSLKKISLKKFSLKKISLKKFSLKKISLKNKIIVNIKLSFTKLKIV